MVSVYIMVSTLELLMSVSVSTIRHTIEATQSHLSLLTSTSFSSSTLQEIHQRLADKKQLHVVEFQDQRGPLPMVVASPKDGARPTPDSEDEIPNTRLYWDDVRAAQGVKRSIWAGVKRTIW